MGEKLHQDVSSRGNTRSGWLAAGISFGIIALFTLAAAVAPGRGVHVCGIVAFTSAMAFYRSYTRLADRYEGLGFRRNRGGHFLVSLAFVSILLWLVYDGFVGEATGVTAARTLLFFLLLICLCQLLSLALEHSERQRQPPP